MQLYSSVGHTLRHLISLFSASALARCALRRRMQWYCFAFTYTGSSSMGNSDGSARRPCPYIGIPCTCNRNTRLHTSNEHGSPLPHVLCMSGYVFILSWMKLSSGGLGVAEEESEGLQTCVVAISMHWLLHWVQHCRVVQQMCSHSPLIRLAGTQGNFPL